MPSSMQDVLNKALAQYKDGHYKEALADLNTLPTTQRASEPVLALIANIHAKLGNLQEASQAFLMLTYMPVDARADYAAMAVRFLLASGNGSVVARDAARLIEVGSGNAALLVDIMTTCLGQGLAENVAGFVDRLDVSDPHQAMLGMRVLRAAKRDGEVIPFLDKVLAVRPNDGLFNAERFSQALTTCDFDVAEECKAAILEEGNVRGANMQAAEALHRRLMWTDDAARLLKPGLEVYTTQQRIGDAKPMPRRAISASGGKLRIAYLSNDFAVHATMFLLKQVLLDHDANHFEFGLFCYTPLDQVIYQAEWPAELREKLIPVHDLSDIETAHRISEWKADILVDLKGFTGDARPGVVKLSDAPVKVAWLGYPGSVPGIDLDYCIADPIVASEGDERFYEEKLCRLPECYQPNDAHRARPQNATRAEAGLPEDAFVFASFNAAMKLNRDTISLWSRLLEGKAGSVFWCLDPGETARGNIVAAFNASGIAPERIIFAKPLPFGEHINRVPLADLALDTFPCGGHTTTSDMLWAGVPVLTRMGQSFASRVSASLLTAIGAPELITQNAEDYLQLGLHLASNTEKLAQLRNRIAGNRASSTLFDSARLTRHLELAYQLMAERARAGLRPDHIAVPVLPPGRAAAL